MVRSNIVFNIMSFFLTLGVFSGISLIYFSMKGNILLLVVSYFLTALGFIFGGLYLKEYDNLTK